ncbi:MAG: hypothetical protein EA376_01590 [Phycisphaeraceae bacterium]|nr:MAG: hypothetical protein EA376_01590 [Phycisphaeraceae bacterium]
MKRHTLQLILAIAIFACLHTGVARGQQAPAGNQHPDSQWHFDESISNPFDTPPRQATASAAEKREFARSVDLEPLRDLAVSHNGRVKILDTLAREVIEGVTGRNAYMDLGDDAEDGQGRTRYDPLFTYLDLLIDPAHYIDRSLIHVRYLPLRRALIGEVIDDESERELWLRRGRLSPRMIMGGFGPVAERHGTDPEMAAGLQDIRAVFELLEHGYGQLYMIAPASSRDSWLHVSTMSPASPVRQAFRDLAESWRALDGEGVEAAANSMAKLLPAINPDQYPGAQRRIESFYNASSPFEYGYWAYCISFVALLLAFGTGRRWLISIGVATLAFAIILHTLGFGARWFIAERYPIQNQFESMIGVALGGAGVGFALMLVRRQWLYGAAAAGAGFLVLLTATETGVPGASIGREAAILNTSALLKYHVTTVLISYGLITLGFFISSLYLLTHYTARGKAARDAAALAAKGLGIEDESVAGPQRVLADLDRAQLTVLQLAFWTLGVGVLLGAWWADHSWGRWWAFDPKETWALITWIVYLIVIHARIGLTRNRGLVTAWLSVLGFFVMLWTYFGVNLLLPGLHAYA